MADVLIEQGIELFQQLCFWWESGGREAVIETAEAVGTLIVLIIVEDIAAEALDAAIVDSKTKNAGGSQSKTAPSTSTPASPNNGKNNKNNKKQSRRSDKEKSTNKPSWLNRNDIDFSQTPQQNATRLMNQKYGVGNWTKGCAEYSQIVKWIQRDVFYYIK